MGNRVNIGLTSKANGTVQVYAHSHGERSAVTLANALDRGRGRWGDDSYLTRIIISEFVHEIGWDSETGMGISGRRVFGRDDLTVYFGERPDEHGIFGSVQGTVKIGKYGVGDGGYLKAHRGTHTFEEFIALVKANPDLYAGYSEEE